MSIIFWILPIYFLGVIIQHVLISETREKLLNAIPHSGGIEHCFIDQEKHKLGEFGPRKSGSKAEVIFTEHGIYIFHYVGLDETLKLYSRYYCLYYDDEQILPFLKSQWTFRHRIFVIDFMKINGRKITFNFKKKLDHLYLGEYEMTMNPIKTSEAYRSILLFQRHWVEKLEQEKRDKIQYG